MFAVFIEARPFACREYFVTTPKELCSDPVRPSGKDRTRRFLRTLARLMFATAAAFLLKSSYKIPLTLAYLCHGAPGGVEDDFTMAIRSLRELSAICSDPAASGPSHP